MRPLLLSPCPILGGQGFDISLSSEAARKATGFQRGGRGAGPGKWKEKNWKKCGHSSFSFCLADYLRFSTVCVCVCDSQMEVHLVVGDTKVSRNIVFEGTKMDSLGKNYKENKLI